MTVDGVANSRIFCRHPPHGVASMSPSAMVRITSIARSPAAAIAAIAPASAQVPSGDDAFSTLHPVKMRPDGVRSAAPTGKCEYGACALPCAARAAAIRSGSVGLIAGSYVWRSGQPHRRADTTGAFGHCRDGHLGTFLARHDPSHE